MKINNAAAAAAAAPAFVSAMASAASKADHANLAAAAGVLIIIRDAGGTNKKAASALWALLPDNVVTTFAQVKRINGAMNAVSEKASEGASTIRPLWLAAKSGKAFTDALLAAGIKSPRALLDLVAPRTEKAEGAPKKAVDTFLAAAKANGFNEDITPILIFITERHAKQMQAMLATAEKALNGALTDAAAKNAAAAAKQEKAAAASAAKKAAAEERARKHAAALKTADDKAAADKSAAAKKAADDKAADAKRILA